MEDQTEVHDEVVLRDVLQGDDGCQSHKGITFQDIRGIKTKPTVGCPKSRLKGVLERQRNPKSQRKKACESRQVQSLGCLNKANSSVDINSLEEHSNVEQVSQLVDNFTQESVFCSHLVGQDYVVGQIVETNQVSVAPDDNL
ncbi:hypothetical protein SO802_016871 [Lithocarpus litseifolius]|uniref:Uncharacterized protein n=1 Tax=Lithocarpus litseifolius TaxID=425828 RepID=A0AAW2CXS0_9ROSI